jgi:endoglucanase
MSMQTSRILQRCLFAPVVAALALFVVAGCKSNKSECCTTDAAKPAAATAPAIEAPVKAAEPKPVLPTIRIKAGSTGFTDSNGNAWLPDQGFVEGDVIERPELAIANTKDPTIYRAERYSMTSFSQALPNGKYTVKLHFAETYEGITAAGERVFSFNVEGHEFKDFDVFVKAGGVQKAYVESVDVDITDGKLDITFTPNIENPEINGIEIIPKS